MPSIPADAFGSSYDTVDAVGANPGIPSDNFTFGNVLSNLWGSLKPVVLTGTQVWGQVEVAKLQADAQARLNAMKTVNPTLGPNDPAAAQAYANKTLAAQFLPLGTDGKPAYGRLIFAGLLLAGFVWLVVKIIRAK